MLMPPSLVALTPRTFWMPPAPPDRPSLLALVGARETVLFDAGASAAHAAALLDALAAAGPHAPVRTMAVTHWHWDHVFGAAHIVEATGAALIAHTHTAERLAQMARLAWDDAALAARVADGREIAFCADNIRLELPAPRTVHIPPVVVRFSRELLLDAGGAHALLVHVGGDHADDSVVAWLPGERVLFLGDALCDAIYDTPARYLTTARLFPLLDRLEAFPAEHVIEGHGDEVMSAAAFARLIAQFRAAGLWADAHADAAPSLLEAGGWAERLAASTIDRALLDDDLTELAGLFLAGHAYGFASAVSP
jgi:glyoxylase-like metal-dependent hydrolase (beta-lactamase superfamily II)